MKLSDLLQQIYIEMGLLRISTIESGSKSTIVDSSLCGVSFESDWMDGTAIILSADEQPPEGEFARVVGFENNFGTLTMDNDLTEAVGAGDTFGLAGALLPLNTLIELVNYATRSLGEVPLIEEVGIETSGEVVWNERPPILVDINRSSGYQNWQRLLDWEYVPGVPGTDWKIIFRSGTHVESELRVWYVDKHPALKNFNDQVSEVIASELAAAVCIEKASCWMINKLGGGDKYQKRMLEDAKKNLDIIKANHPIWRPRRGARMMLANMGGN